MSTATKTAPRFRVGDWVSYLFGFRRVIGQVVEDRGRLGLQGGRLYSLAIERDEDEVTTTVIPEDDLEPAPEILAPSVATERGFATQNWPRQAFNFTYRRGKGSNSWTVKAKAGERLGRGRARGAVAYTTGRWESEPVGSEDHAIVSVLLECDPRLVGPRSPDDPVWRAITTEARQLANEMFKSRHPKSVIEEDQARR
jgi:hypothetical protein